MKWNRPLILASKSPRRSQLLSQAGFEFSIQTKDTEESYPAQLPPQQVPTFLAEKKAMACQAFLQKETILIAADTIVIQEGLIYEKPKDRADAIRILTTLSGKMHEVITGVCLLSKDKQMVFAGQSNVFFASISAAEIEYYVDTYQPYDKAGAYAIQEWIGLCKITKIEGTYANIMGLPVDLVYKNLMEHFLK